MERGRPHPIGHRSNKINHIFLNRDAIEQMINKKYDCRIHLSNTSMEMLASSFENDLERYLEKINCFTDNFNKNLDYYYNRVVNNISMIGDATYISKDDDRDYNLSKKDTLEKQI